jgi:hypothetical protein
MVSRAMPSPRRSPPAPAPPADLSAQIAELRGELRNALDKLTRIEQGVVWLVVRDRTRRKGRPCPPPPPPPGDGWEKPEVWNFEAWKPE